MIEKHTLEQCVEKGMSTTDISKYVNCSKTNVGYWLKKYNLKTKWSPKGHTYVDLKCEKCGCNFQKKLKIYNLEIKRNPDHKFYCSADCAGTTVDELSPFRKALSGARARAKVHKRELNLDLKYLKNLWDKQNGICAISGLKMLKPEYQCHDSKVKNRTPYRASLDRITSTKGYVKGNLQWVCTFVNYAKNNFDDAEIKEVFMEMKQK